MATLCIPQPNWNDRDTAVGALREREKTRIEGEQHLWRAWPRPAWVDDRIALRKYEQYAAFAQQVQRQAICRPIHTTRRASSSPHPRPARAARQTLEHLAGLAVEPVERDQHVHFARQARHDGAGVVQVVVVARHQDHRTWRVRAPGPRRAGRPLRASNARAAARRLHAPMRAAMDSAIPGRRSPEGRPCGARPTRRRGWRIAMPRRRGQTSSTSAIGGQTPPAALSTIANTMLSAYTASGKRAEIDGTVSAPQPAAQAHEHQRRWPSSPRKFWIGMPKYGSGLMPDPEVQRQARVGHGWIQHQVPARSGNRRPGPRSRPGASAPCRHQA